MAIPEIKEMKAQWHAEVQPEYTLKDVAAHNLKDDIWIAIYGQGKSSYPWSLERDCSSLTRVSL